MKKTRQRTIREVHDAVAQLPGNGKALETALAEPASGIRNCCAAARRRVREP